MTVDIFCAKVIFVDLWINCKSLSVCRWFRFTDQMDCWSIKKFNERNGFCRKDQGVQERLGHSYQTAPNIQLPPLQSLSLKLVQTMFLLIFLARQGINQVPGYSTAQKWSFPLRIYSVNVTKSAVSYGFDHIYWRNPQRKTTYFVQCSHFVQNNYVRTNKCEQRIPCY